MNPINKFFCCGLQCCTEKLNEIIQPLRLFKKTQEISKKSNIEAQRKISIMQFNLIELNYSRFFKLMSDNVTKFDD